jgi:hypothetical protein
MVVLRLVKEVRMKHLVIALVAGVAITGLAPVLLQKAVAQKKEETATRSVQGAVTDSADSPVEGAVVQLKDTKSLQIRSFITKENGTYYFHNLRTDVDYELKAEYQGSASDSRTLSSFDSRKKAIMNLKLEGRK